MKNHENEENERRRVEADSIDQQLNIPLTHTPWLQILSVPHKNYITHLLLFLYPSWISHKIRITPIIQYRSLINRQWRLELTSYPPPSKSRPAPTPPSPHWSVY